MRILLLFPHPFFKLRGSPIAERALLRVLAERGYELHVLTYPYGEDPDVPNCTVHRTVRIPGVKLMPPGLSGRKLLYDGLMAVRALRLARRLRPDVIHAVEEAVFIALGVGAVTRTPVVYDMDSSLPEQLIDAHPTLRPFERPLRAMERLAIRRSDAVLVMSRYLEELARNSDPEKLVGRVEDMSLLGDSNGRGERLRDLTGRDAPVVLYVGNLAEYQGVDLLLEGFAEARRRGADAQLVVIGGSSDRRIDEQRRRARDLGIDPFVHFLGPRPLSQLGWYLRQADVLVSPRKSGKNTPQKIYSYMESGRPVLATRMRTHTQVLGDETACLVDPEPKALGEGLVRLLRDEALRRRLGRAARERARRRYGPEAFQAKLLGFYRALEAAIDGSPPPPARKLPLRPRRSGV